MKLVLSDERKAKLREMFIQKLDEGYSPSYFSGWARKQSFRWAEVCRFLEDKDTIDIAWNKYFIHKGPHLRGSLNKKKVKYGITNL